jgi:hypothetical protein
MVETSSSSNLENVSNERVENQTDISLVGTHSNLSNGSLASESRLRNFTTNTSEVNRLKVIHESLEKHFDSISNESISQRLFIQESNEKIMSKLEVIEDSAENFWSITFTDVVSVVLAIIAGWLTIPPFLFGTFYRPKLEIFLPPSFHYEKNATIRWSEISDINIRNNTSRRFTIQVEVKIDKPWSSRIQASNLYPSRGIGGGFWAQSIELPIAGGLGSALTFPFEPEPEDCSLDLVVYPRFRLSEFGFPRYFGEIDSHPIRAHYRVTGR